MKPEPRPWGIWATIGFTGLIGMVFFFIFQIIGIIFVLIAKINDPNLDILKIAKELDNNGFFISISSTVTSIGRAAFNGNSLPNVTIRYSDINAIDRFDNYFQGKNLTYEYVSA